MEGEMRAEQKILLVGGSCSVEIVLEDDCPTLVDVNLITLSKFSLKRFFISGSFKSITKASCGFSVA